ncbi:MAG: GvpL/GvpF family gas vesicle protein [Trichodesmium sp. St11_bin5]|nr:GvpL/GvpF family gas vesicle protein [Trichodesmium sp. St11_bin5]
MEFGFYVYGLIQEKGKMDESKDESKNGLKGSNELKDELKGLDKEDVKIQDVDEFAVLYSIAKKERYLASRRNLITHEKVLESAMEAGYRNLLPMQFGLVVSEWEKFSQDFTKPCEQQIHDLFTKLKDNREVGIKIYWEPDAELEKLLENDKDLKEERDSLKDKKLTMDQVIDIGQKIEQGMNERKQNIIEIFQETLNKMAIEVIENEVQTEKMIYNAAYLIPWDQEEDFGEKVETIDSKLCERGNFTIRYNSFTAPYNFARIRQQD